MHKTALSETALARGKRLFGKLHPFETINPRRTALLVIDMQNYFVKPGHQAETPMAREIVPNINRLAAELRRRGGHRGLDSQRHERYASELVDLPRTSADA